MEKKKSTNIGAQEISHIFMGFTSSPVCRLHLVSEWDRVTDVLYASCLIIDLLLRTTP